MDQLAKKYSEVEFVFVYCHEAHPPKDNGANGGGASLQPDTYAGRLEIARRMREETHLQRRLLPDAFGDDCVFDRYLSAKLDNPLVVVDREGKIACALPWTQVEEVEPFLEQLMAHGGKWDRTLRPPTTAPAQSASPSFKAMTEHLDKALRKK